MAEITKDQVVEFISKMSVLDLSELVKEMEEKFGVSAAAAVAVAPAAGGDAGGDASAPVEQHGRMLAEGTLAELQETHEEHDLEEIFFKLLSHDESQVAA